MTDRSGGPDQGDHDDRVEGALAALRLTPARPLPDALRDRLETALLAETAPPIDSELHDRLADALVDPAVVLSGIDGPRPLPASLHAALTSELATSAPRRAAVPRWLLGAAAALTLAASATALSGILRDDRATNVAARPQAVATTSSTIPNAEEQAVGAAALSAPTTRSRAASKTAGSGTASLAAASLAAQRYGRPPPFTFPALDALSFAAPNGAPAPTPTTRPPQPALRIGIVAGDAAAEAGFRAYVHLLNDAGGAGGRVFNVVTVDPSHPAANVAATANLSSAPVATASGPPSWAGFPLLETVTAPESLLRNDVFTFSSAVERQAHLAVDEVVPAGSAGKRVVIYRMASGPLGAEVPTAMTDIVQRHGATAVTVVYDGGPTSVIVPGDVALLSLDTPTAALWFRQAKQENAFPPGIAGISTLFDSSLLGDMPSATKIMSPYSINVPSEEAAALKTNTRRSLSTSLIDGWVAAKTLAVAVWERDASTSTALRAALVGLQSEHFSSNWGPPYDVRPNTRSRTPEGVLLEVSGGNFSVRGSFRRDPF